MLLFSSSSVHFIKWKKISAFKSISFRKCAVTCISCCFYKILNAFCISCSEWIVFCIRGESPAIRFMINVSGVAVMIGCLQSERILRSTSTFQMYSAAFFVACIHINSRYFFLSFVSLFFCTRISEPFKIYKPHLWEKYILIFRICICMCIINENLALNALRGSIKKFPRLQNNIRDLLSLERIKINVFFALLQVYSFEGEAIQMHRMWQRILSITNTCRSQNPPFGGVTAQVSGV